ncbi:MAG: HEAT repeat domain-containing protein [Gemmatimonadales bacterium]
MTESAGPEAGQETLIPPAQVEELLNVLGKALRAHQLYLPNNPVYQKSIENLKESLRKILQSVDELVLDIGEHDLRWQGNVVYSQPSRSESFSWVFFKDGVRQLSLKTGVEDAEIIGLLDVVHRARQLQAEDNDDLLTLLWEKDFQFIHYQFQEMVMEGGFAALPGAGDVQAPTTPAASVRTSVVAEVDEGDEEEEGGDEPGEAGGEAAPRKRPGIVSASDFDTTLYFLDEREIEFLRKEVADEYSQDIRRNVLAMLFDVMELQPFATVRTELVSILESFLPYLLGASDFGAVAYVLRESRAVLQRARELMPEHKEALEKLPARLSEEAALSQLLQSLDEAAVHTAPEELVELFGELRPEALPTLFAWLPKLSNERVRAMVETSVQRLAQANAATVVKALQASNADAAIAAIRVAARLKLASAVQALAQCLDHQQPSVRVAAVQALADIASPAAIQALEKSLDDSDREVRLAAVRVVGQHKSRSALPKITTVVTGKSVRQADLTEKMAFFEAYGVLVGESGVDLLDGILNSGGFLKRKENPETRACAAMALGRIGSQAARDALNKAAQDKEPLVKSAVMRAIRGERSSSMFRAGEIPGT